MKFKDLIFEGHPVGVGERARHEFDNGVVLSVLKGDTFYSNGVDSFEIGVFDENGDWTREYFNDDVDVDDDVRGYLIESEVEEIIENILKKA